jgi:transcriptional regulator with XRE-family HTH domain
MIKSTNTPSYKALIDWLKINRLSQKLSMRELASRLDEPHQFVHKIESGDRSLSIGEYVQYCDALNLDCTVGLKFFKKKN